MLNLSDFSVENIKSGKLADQLPEFYALKDIIENNAGHINDPVFDHCVRTGEAMFSLYTDLPQKIKNILQEKIGIESRKELLFISALLHDVGKLKVPMDNQGGFIGHELAGAELARDFILKRINISPEVQAHIVSIIENHGMLHAMSNDPERLKDRVLEVGQKYPSIFLELILLVLADLIASDLLALNPTVYNFKVSFFKQTLTDWK